MSDPQTYVVTINHIVVTTGIIFGGIYTFIRFYVKSISADIKEVNDRTITDARNAIEKTFDKQISAIKDEISSSAIKLKVKDYIDGEQRIFENDLKTIKEAVLDTRTLVVNQQEQLLVMQTSITEIRPKIDYIDERLKKVEYKVENSNAFSK